MCGLVGGVGHGQATAHLLGALERLEYRGYDSAGICLLTPRGLRITKAVGQVAHLVRRA